MACSEYEGKVAMPLLGEATEDKVFIAGVTEGQEDFLEGHCRYFKDAEELEAYSLSL